jgi:hypothetical protein
VCERERERERERDRERQRVCLLCVVCVCVCTEHLQIHLTTCSTRSSKAQRLQWVRSSKLPAKQVRSRLATSLRRSSTPQSVYELFCKKSLGVVVWHPWGDISSRGSLV